MDPEVKMDQSLLGEEGSEKGIMSAQRALQLAQQMGLDLVEVSPHAIPPVVRVMDYGKFIFDSRKVKKKQRAPKLKEIKLRPVTDEGDYKVKLRNLMSFLEQGDKVKVTIRFRGRELAHQELGMRHLTRIVADVEGKGVVDMMPKLEGKQMVMVISPKSKKS